jgi:hypothetical protein
MIDKVIPQRLNSDVDSRFRPSTDMIDALNIAFQESYNSDVGAAGNSASNNFSGDAGVIKPMPSNKSIEEITQMTDLIASNTNVRVIGSVSDEVYNVIYFFAWSDNLDQMGVYAWDQDAVLPGNTIPGSYVKVYTSAKFDFPSDGFVKADVVHVGQRKNIDDEDRVRNVIVYFTDNRNEPRKLNVYDVMEANLDNHNDIDILDMITACPRTPLTPISFEFNFDPARASSNFTSLPGLQFAYQHVYSDNVESALSTYSKLAVPPAYLALGQVTGSVNLQNRCVLTIPRGSREVDRIRVLVRYGNLGLWRLIDEIKELEDAVDSVEYNFYNDRILIPVSEETTAMPYSNLPRIAQAQTVVSDRLMYGNYVEGYSEVEASAELTPVYNGTPRQGDVIEISVVPVLNQFDATPDDPDSDSKRIYKELGTNRVAGYQINLDGVPEDFLEEGTIIQIDFTVEPDNNFHFYNQHNSYHGSRENGFYGGQNNLTGTNIDNVNDALIDVQVDSGDFVDNVNQYSRGRQYFGKNQGVKFIDGLFNKWKYSAWGNQANEYGGIIDVANDDTVSVCYGTSAANPFIIESKPLRFAVTFKTMYGTDSPRSLVKQALYHYLTGGPMPANNEGQDFASTEGLPEPTNLASYEINLLLNTGDTINAASGNDYRKHLIVGLKTLDGISPGDRTDEPIGFFIVNEAKVEMGLKAFTYMEGLYDTEPGQTNCYVGLDLKKLTDVDVMTCVPYVPVGTKVAMKIPQSSFPELNTSTWYGVGPLNIVNGNISYWTVFSRETMQSSTPEQLNVFDTGDAESWLGPVAYTENGVNAAVGSDDTRNMYFFGTYNAYLSVFAQQTNEAGNIFPDSGIQPANDLGLSICPAALNGPRGQFCLGYMVDNSESVNSPLSLVNTSDELFEHIIPQINDSQLVNECAVFSLVDGEGGPGFTKNRTGIGEFVSWGSISPYVLFKGDIHNRWIVNIQELPYTNYYPVSSTGAISDALNLGDPDPGDTPGFGQQDDGWKKSKGFLKGYRNLDINLPSNEISRDYFQGPIANLTYDHPIADTVNTWIEISVLNTYISGITGLYYPRSFKTNANHDFGIVYYDQRGRSGNVNYLGNTFVRGYSNADRSIDAKGRVDVLLNLTSNPPDWATQYQIVYSPNSTVGDFVQYTTGPAFVATVAETDPEAGNEALIYVNLGHLQGVNNVSYSHAFGAVNNDGGKDLYAHQPGDRLRILYYTESDGDDVVYPRDYVFDIVDVVTLTRNREDNILYDPETSGTLSPAKSGQFLVLKNNPNATGFSYTDVLNSYNDADGTQEVDGSTALNYWNNRTVVEIFTPKKVQDFDQRFYYEIGEKYDVTINSQGTPLHSQSSILLRDGDVWWRRVPVNLQEYNEDSGRFLTLFSSEDSDGSGDDESLPAFATQVLETMAFTDVIPGCKTLDWGKPKVIVPGSQSLYKRSSLTYSEKNDYAARANKYTIFNAPSLNFKDLPNEYGAINYILNDYDNVVVIQEDKCSSIPVSRNIITTAGGQQSLVASKDVLGTQKFYAGDYGADNNPESVVRAGEAIYFAHKGRREVYKLTRSKGLKVISKANMKAHFNNLFVQAIAAEKNDQGKVRVVSGYDPLRDEYIISVHNMKDYTASEANYNQLTGVFDGVGIVIDDSDFGPQFDDPVPVAPDFPSGDEGGGEDPDPVSEAPQIRLQPEDILDFGILNTGVSIARPLTIANSGNSNLVITSFSVQQLLTNDIPAVFVLPTSNPTPQNPIVILPNESIDVTVVCSGPPVSFDVNTNFNTIISNLSVSSNDELNPEASVVLTASFRDQFDGGDDGGDSDDDGPIRPDDDDPVRPFDDDPTNPVDDDPSVEDDFQSDTGRSFMGLGVSGNSFVPV